MLSKLYARWGITEETDFRQLAPEDYPILSDLYDLMQEELAQYKPGALYTQELLQEVLLALHSLCVGADAPFFNGHTNISGDRFLVFGGQEPAECPAVQCAGVYVGPAADGRQYRSGAG